MATSLIQPAIATVQQVADYCGLDAFSLVSQGYSGSPTLSEWLQEKLNMTAWLLVEWCDYDYTTSQVGEELFEGDNTNYHDFKNPIITPPTSGVLWQLEAPLTSVKTFASLSLGLSYNSNNSYRLYLVDGSNNAQIFQKGTMYAIQYVTADIFNYLPPTNGNIAGGKWPMPLQQIQIEMVAVIFQESNFGYGRGSVTSEVFGSVGRLGRKKDYLFDVSTNVANIPIQFDDMVPRWKQACRPYRRITI